MWTTNVICYREKHHPNQTEAMREAMNIYESRLNQCKKEKEKKNKKANNEDDETAADTPKKKMK